MSSNLKPIQRLFVFTGNEIVVLALISLMMAVFTFTVGVHLGKRVGNRPAVELKSYSSLITQLPDRIPDRDELTERAKGAEKIVDETLNQDLYDEVIRSGVQLHHSHEVDLPSQTKGPTGGATTLLKQSGGESISSKSDR